MKILALDSTAHTSSVAILDNEKLITLYTVNTDNTHSETLLPMISSALSASDISIDEIDVFAASNGPGSFTGVRIGAATLKGLAFGRNVKCVEVSTIEALARNLDGIDGIVCPIMNARRGQVYTGAFKGKKCLINDTCMLLCDLIPTLEEYNERIYFVGDGYELIENSDIKNKCETPEIMRYQNAYSVGIIAYEKVKNEEYTNDVDFRVNYLRKPQAEREREERLEKEGKK
ncbi:MAG: tRNA (adenosine(37)-N6)-threonylcarbamoyltransferase complex dimerization subunit type 1 TsaB [Clostridia bacterium]|nr:tRNA (adenosine(37)-N6)-threonylcarbamoyltransferase complex dimerization subunit type 1 TsaB [Clostridia bacterium]